MCHELVHMLYISTYTVTVTVTHIRKLLASSILNNCHGIESALTVHAEHKYSLFFSRPGDDTLYFDGNSVVV